MLPSNMLLAIQYTEGSHVFERGLFLFLPPRIIDVYDGYNILLFHSGSQNAIISLTVTG